MGKAVKVDWMRGEACGVRAAEMDWISVFAADHLVKIKMRVDGK